MTQLTSPESLGAALRSARKGLGLTQPELALAAGVGVRFIVELEAGKGTVRLAHVLRVADALGLALSLAGHDGVAPARSEAFAKAPTFEKPNVP